MGKREEGEKWLARPFMLPRGGDQGRMASVILFGGKYATIIMVKLIYAPNKNTKFFLLQEKAARGIGLHVNANKTEYMF